MLLSSCEYLKTSTPNTPQASTSIRPTLELSLNQLSEVGGNMTLELTSPDSAFTHSMPYQVCFHVYTHIWASQITNEWGVLSVNANIIYNYLI